MTGLTLIINMEIYKSPLDDKLSIREDHNAHPDILFIGGSCCPYNTGDELKRKESIIQSLKRQAPNRRIINVIFNLIDCRLKQATLGDFAEVTQ